MQTQELAKVIIITAEKGKYLIPKKSDDKHFVKLMGKPVRIVLDKTGIIPEFEEREVIE